MHKKICIITYNGCFARLWGKYVFLIIFAQCVPGTLGFYNQQEKCYLRHQNKVCITERPMKNSSKYFPVVIHHQLYYAVTKNAFTTLEKFKNIHLKMN